MPLRQVLFGVRNTSAVSWYFGCDIFDFNGNLVFPASTVQAKSPYICNTAEDLSTGKFEDILVLPGSLSSTDNFTFVVRKCVTSNLDEGVYEKQNVVFSTELSYSSPYYKDDGSFVDPEFWFEIPRSSLGIAFNNGEKYIFSLEKDGEVIQDIVATIGGLTEEDKEYNRFETIKNAIDKGNKDTANAIKDTTNAVKEQTEVSKNIFQKIGEILSYINPFSENFFGRKLVELILDGLKGLFVPKDGFFNEYFDDLKNWFSDRLGFLWTPFDIVIEILNRILNINFTEPIFIIPDIYEPFTNQKFISAQEYNLNSLLDNEVFLNIHNIYLICVDAFIIFSLINLAERKIEEVFSN